MGWNLVSQILAELDAAPLSTSLSRSLRVAQRIGVKDLEKWIRLESVGYYGSNPAMTEDVKVPEYRTVAGQRVNQFGQVLQVPDGLDFVNTDRLRNPVVELEQLRDRDGWITYQDPSGAKLIREHLKVDVEFFRFTAIHLAGVLNQIKTRLSDKLLELEPTAGDQQHTAQKEGSDILEIKPNFYGVGVNLRELWRRKFKE